MRVVLDTNTVVSAFLWGKAPRRILEAARERRISLLTSAPLLGELADVLSREKFATQIASSEFTADQLVARYALLASSIVPAQIRPLIAADPDDDAVIACAVAARADYVVSGDNKVLNLKHYQGISIIGAGDFVRRIPTRSP